MTEVCPTGAISCYFGLPLIESGGGAVLPRVPQLCGHLQAVHLVSLFLAACEEDVVDAAGGAGHLDSLI